MPVNTSITFRKGSATQWSDTNPVLASGEPGYDLTNNILKIGDGVSAWNSLNNHQHTTSNISGLNSTATELNYLQGVTPGTGIANKALVLDSVGSIQVPLLIQSYGVEASFLYAPDSNILNIASNSGSFNNSLKVNNIPVSVSGHTHLSSDITNFNSSVSGLISEVYAPLNNPNFSGILSISGVPLGEVIDDEVAGLLVAGSGISLNYNDSANILTVNSLVLPTIRQNYTINSTQSTFTVSAGYTIGYLDIYYNGVKLISGSDYTATDGTTFTLTSQASSGDVIEAMSSTSSIGLSDAMMNAYIHPFLLAGI